MACNSKTLRITTIAFNGINHTPINKTAEVTMGGEMADTTAVDNSGKAFSGTKMDPGLVEFEIPNNAAFNPDNYRGQCGDVMVLTTDGQSYLCANAQHKGELKAKDGEPTIKLSFVGDAVIAY